MMPNHARAENRGSSKPQRRRWDVPAIMLAGAALVAIPVAALAQKVTPAEGRRIAERYCARCHVVAPSGGTGWTDAPAFAEIAQDSRISRAWMRGFTTRTHMHMLNTDRSPAEADAIAAYLLSLRRKP